jgi:Ca2+-binding RTX toxin-like protein
VRGSDDGDTITVTNSSITFNGSTVTYVPPEPRSNILQIKIKAGDGNDTITIESTAATVPVRVEVGDGDDTVKVGTGLVDNIIGTALPGEGLGPLVLVGSGGHDTLIIDDSQDTENNDGNITAFIEERVTGQVEVGVVSGLGMVLNVFGEAMEGRVEFESFDVVDVRMGSGDDLFTVGGERGFVTATEIDVQPEEPAQIQNIIITNPEQRFFKIRLGDQETGRILHTAGAADVAAALTAAGIGFVSVVDDADENKVDADGNPVLTYTVTFDDIEPRMRALDLSLFPPVRLEGITEFVHTISGMTIISGGGGDDQINVIATNEIQSAIQLDNFSTAGNPPSNLTTIASDRIDVITTQPGIRGVQEEIVTIAIKADSGFFTLQFADPDGTDTVPGAEQTVPLSYSLSDPEVLKAALADLRLVGGTGFVDVAEDNGVFTITFDALLGDLPDLVAVDLPLYIDGGAGDDTINIQSINAQTFVFGGTGDDTINVNVELTPLGRVADLVVIDRMSGPRPGQTVGGGVQDLLTLDGGGGSDHYFVYMFGGDANSLINVFDTGAANDGFDTLEIVGTPEADLFLMRAAVALDGLAFISMLKPAQIADPGEPPIVHDVERLNYDTNLNSITVFAIGGKNQFMIDDTRAAITIFGGDDDDFFQIGQLYKSQRTPAAGVPNADVFATLETTRGFLSNGISEPMQIFGGAGDDEFVVYHNLAPLQLFGEDGNDFFMIRAFALIGSVDNLRERTDVSTGAGANTVMYAVNAPVKIDGGTGFNTLIVIGTEFGDDFVVTENGIFGAGINVEYTNIQSIEIDGAEGDDRFFILGTAAGTVTRITGGLGSDTFFVNGETPPVISNDLLGHSGLISHHIDSLLNGEQGSFAGTKVEGISANVADDDEPAIRIVQSGGSSTVSQARGDTDNYWIVLTRKPENDAEVVVTAIAPQGIKLVGPSNALLDGVTLTFTAANWDKPQEIVFQADEQGIAQVETKRDGGSGENEIQLLAIDATKGSFSLTFEGNTTDAIEFKPDDLGGVAEAIKTALEGLAAFDTDSVKVENTAGSTFEIEFLGTEGVGNNLSQLEVNFAIENKGEADEFGLFTHDLEGSTDNFITHRVQVQEGVAGQGTDSISGLFVTGEVAHGERTLSLAGGLPAFILDQGDDVLRGATVKIIAGAGSGQVRTVIANDGNKLTVSEPWFTPLDETSRIEILRYAGVVLPSVSVTIVGDDGPALDVRETDGGTWAVEAPEIHGIKAGDALADHDGFVDTISVGLAMPPIGDDVTVTLDGGGQLSFFIVDDEGKFKDVTVGGFKLNSLNPVSVYVVGVDDQLVEGLHKQLVTITADYGNDITATSTLIVDIWDNNVPMALVVESDGSTDVIERGNGNFDGIGNTFGPPEAINGTNLALDDYQVVLTKAPEAGEVVTVTVIADPTRTDRGGGQLGIRSATEQVELSVDGGETWGFTQELTFTIDDWFIPQNVMVRAVADDRVDGGDSKSFATQLDLATKIQGPLIITGGPTEDRSADLEREPAMLPGETNFKPSVGSVVDATSTSLTVNMEETIPGLTSVSTAVQGGSAGSATVTENRKGVLNDVAEIQVLTIDALAGTFKLQLGAQQTDTITFDANTPGSVAEKIKDELESLTGIGIGNVEVDPAGSTFFITFASSLGDVDLLQVVDDELRKVNAFVEVAVTGTATVDEVQHLAIRGATGGEFTLLLNNGTDVHETASIAFDRDDTTTVASEMEAKLNTLLAAQFSGNTATVGASGTTFIITFSGDIENFDLGVEFSGLVIDETQVMRIQANEGHFRLGLQDLAITGNLPQVTGDIEFDNVLTQLADNIKEALEGIPGIDAGDVEVVARDGGVLGIFVDITFVGGASDINVSQLQVLGAEKEAEGLKRTVKQAIEAKFGIELNDEADLDQLIDLTLEITQGPGKNKARVITDVTGDVDGKVTFELARPWEGGFVLDGVPIGSQSEFTIESTNPNLLVDENEETDLLILNDTDSVVSYRNVIDVDGDEQTVFLPAGALTVTADRLHGLGMSAGQDMVPIGTGDDKIYVPGGISYFGLDEIFINLGSGDNLITIEDTHAGATTINAGDGDDTFFIHGISGHTYLNGGPGADEFIVSNADNRLSDIARLLTITGDISQVKPVHLVRGSGAQAAFLAPFEDRVDMMINATGGEFTLAFDGEETQPLDFDASDPDVLTTTIIENALVALDGISVGQVEVTRISNSIFRIDFAGDLAGTGAENLLSIDDTKLTGAFVDPVDATQQFTVEATGGTFQIGFTDPATGEVHFTGDLNFNAEAAAVQAALVGLEGITPGDVVVERFGSVYRVMFMEGLGGQPISLLQFNDRNLTSEGPIDVLTIDDSGNQDPTTLLLTSSSITGLGMAGVNEIQTLRLNATEGEFQLSFTDAEVTELRKGRAGVDEVQQLFLIAQSGSFNLTFDPLGANETTDPIAFDFVTDTPEEVAQKIEDALNELSIEVTVEALDASRFIITFLDSETDLAELGIEIIELENQTTALAHDISGADLQAALQGLAGIGAGNVRVDQNDDVYVIRFQGLLANTDLPQFEVVAGHSLARTVELPGGETTEQLDGLIEVATRQDGVTIEARNELQRLIIDATDGTFTLAFGEADNKTAALAHDLTAGQLQIALEALDGINVGDVQVTDAGSGVFDIEFLGGLSSKNVPQLILESDLVGTGSIQTLQDGGDTGVNQVQVLTVDATGGSYQLTIHVPGVVQAPFTTDPIAFDASADEVRRALQHALAFALTGADPVTTVPEAFKSDFSVVRVDDTYIIGFQGKTRSIDAGSGVSFLVVDESDLDGSTSVVTRMDGIQYYGIEQLNIITGDGHNIINVQGTSSGSYKLDFDSLHAATNIKLGSGDDQMFISSNADLDHNTVFKTDGIADVFEFLTGDLDDIRGNLNIDFGEGRHRLLISDEGNEVGKNVTISDVIDLTPTGEGVATLTGEDNDVSTLGAAEIQIQGLAKGDITYGADAAGGNFFDGIVYWTGFGDDVIFIDGTHGRFVDGQPVERTTTMLNTGLGDDHVTVELHAGEDGFFVLNTSGGRASADPSPFVDDDGNLLDDRSDNDTVRASASTLPLIIFGGFGNNDIVAGQGDDVVFANFGRVQYVDPDSIDALNPFDPDNAANEELIAVFGFGGRGDMISSNIVDPRWIISRHLTLGGSSIIEGMEGDDVLVGGARGDFIDGGEGRDLIFGDAVELFRRDVIPGVMPAGAITDPRFQALLGQVIYSRNDIPAHLQGLAENEMPEDQFDVGKVLVDGVAQELRYIDGADLPDWAEYQIIELFHSFDIEASNDGSFGDDYIAGGPGENMIFGQLGDDIIQGNGSILSAVGTAGDLNRLVHFQAAIDLEDATFAEGHRFQTLDGDNIPLDGTSVDGTSNTIVFSETHDFENGQRIAYWNDGDGDDIGGLTSGGLYAVHRVDDTTIKLSAPVGAARIVQPDDPIELTPGQFAERYLLAITASFEKASDGDSYIEGGGGNDVIFGNLGQNDIVGGSSSLFSLDEPDQRPDGSNLIFGGAGTRIDRNHFVTNDNNKDGDDILIGLDEIHARNASTIAGNNANIYRLVGTGGSDEGSFLRFNYDNPDLPGYSDDLWIIPRAVELLDYVPGGPDFDPDAFEFDPEDLNGYVPNELLPHGGNNEIHGESGDDYIYGMAGNAVIFGGAGDDRIVGGWGNNWISGGTGNDGIIGDDGRIFTARYTAADGAIDADNAEHYAELLNGVLMVDELNKLISSPGDMLQAVINPADEIGAELIGRLYHTVDLTPFSLYGSDDPREMDLDVAPQFANDIIYAGLGSSFLHGGSGDDAMLGAEALQEFYAAPINPGNVLRFGQDVAIEFPDYDADNPRAKIEPFLLNFETLPQILDILVGMGILEQDGDDLILPHDVAPYLIYEMGLPTDEAGNGIIVIDAHGLPQHDVKIAETVMFGGLGNDWMVGGPDNNVLFGGYGSNLLNVDNDHDTNDGQNDEEDPLNINIEDIAYGGGGRDVLIGNSSGDRLIDWLGEYNTYIVPFAPFGNATVIRSPSPATMDFLYDLSAALGADPTRAADVEGSDPARNGEPYGELGLVDQSDSGLWQQQSGQPQVGPQPGNIGGNQRLSLRGADGGTGGGGGGGGSGQGNTASTQHNGMMAAGPANGTNEVHAALNEADVNLVLGAAVDRLIMALDLDEADVAWLLDVEIEIADLPGLMLGQAAGEGIVIDRYAAGHGWFVDPRPGDDSDFYQSPHGLVALRGSEAEGRMDLLSVVMHELGHLIGLDHDAGGFMADTLEAGVRLAPPTYGAAKTPVGNAQVFIFDEETAQLVERDEARALSNLGNGQSKFAPDDDDDWLLEVASSDGQGKPGNGKGNGSNGSNGSDSNVNGKALESLIGKQLIDWNKSFMGFQPASAGR